MNAVLPLFVALLLVATPLRSEPNPQLALSVASRLVPYGIRIEPGALNTAQAAALHLLMVTDRDKSIVEIRRRVEVILTSPEFRD